MSSLSILFEFAVRASLLGTVGIIAAWIFRGRGAEIQHAIWRVVLAGMLTLPFLMAFVPPIRILPSTTVTAVNPISPAQHIDKALAFRSTSAAVALAPPRSSPGSISTVDWTAVVAAIYLAVAVMMLFRIVISVRRAREIASSAVRVSACLFDDMVYPRPSLRESAETFVPFTVGWRNPVVVLPAGWQEWNEFKLRSVLAHELTHIRRSDWITSLAAAVNRALFWFHPFAWWLEKHLAALAEEVCDTTAMEFSGDPPRYAKVVLEFAELASSRQLGGANLMTHTSKVGRRITNILTNHASPNPIIKGFVRSLMLVVALPVVYLAASLQTTAPQLTDSLKESPPSLYSVMSRSDASRAILSDGWRVTPAEAAMLESELERDPENLSVRIRLVSYYTQHMVRADQRTTHLLWLIEHHPDADVFQIGSVVTSAFSDYTGLNSTENTERARILWLRQTERFATNPMVLSNAATAFSGTDSQLALGFIKRARALEPDNPEWLEWLGEVYATTIRSSFSVGRMVRIGVAPRLHHGFSLSPIQAIAAKREFEGSSDAALLATTADILLREISLLKSATVADAEVQASEAYGKQLLIRAQQLDPNAPRWK